MIGRVFRSAAGRYNPGDRSRHTPNERRAKMSRPQNGPVIALRHDDVEIPAGIVDLPSFRAWTRADGFPDCGRTRGARRGRFPGFGRPRDTGAARPAAQPGAPRRLPPRVGGRLTIPHESTAAPARQRTGCRAGAEDSTPSLARGSTRRSSSPRRNRASRRSASPLRRSSATAPVALPHRGRGS